MCILDQRIDQTTPNLVDMSTHIQRRDMLNIGLIQQKGGARELILYLGQACFILKGPTASKLGVRGLTHQVRAIP